MLNKKNAMDYLGVIADARNKLIGKIKEDMAEYDGEIASLMSRYETDAVKFDDHTEFRKLYTVTVPTEVLELVEKCTVHREENWTRREFDLGRIHFEAYSYGKQADE